MRHQTDRIVPEVFLAGVDGSGKTAARDLLISRFDRNYKILTNHDELFVYSNGKKQPALKRSCFKATNRLKTIAEGSRLTGLLSLLNFVARCLESRLAKKYSQVDLILYETDTVLHPAAFFALHFPWIKRINSSTRFKILHALFGPKKGSVTFYLDTDSHTAVERIKKRNTKTDSHENIQDLQKLKEEFDAMVHLASRNDLQFVTIDTNNKTVESVVSEIERVLQEKLALHGEAVGR